MKNFWKKMWDSLELYLMVALMLGFILTVFWGIISRWVLKAPASWTEELARFFFIWMVFLGISYSTLHNSHIRVTFIAQKLFRRKAGDVLNIVIGLITLAVFAWVFYTGIVYTDYCNTVRTPAMQLPRAWFVSILPLTGGLMIVRTAYKTVLDIRNLLRGPEKEASV